MNQATPPLESGLPEPTVQRRRGISLVWVIPLVAALVGAWLAYRTLSEQGPVVTIQFFDGSGLESGKTPVKYKSVDVGRVSDIALTEDLATVQVTAELNRHMAGFLTENTRFWVVRPRVGASGISGLGTLVSGAYIEMEPGTSAGATRKRFTGLETPPIVSAAEQGRRFVLEGGSLGSLSAGSPIFYRSIQVGQVLGHELSTDQAQVLVYVFVKAPFHDLVTAQSRFWNISGVELSLGADGVNLRVGSLNSLLTGGIAFDSPSSGDQRPAPSKPNALFPLYPSANVIETAEPARPLTYALYFDGSVRGLSRGAPVEFRGIKIGSVRDIKMELDDDFAVRIPVLVDIDPQRITAIGELGKRRADATIAELVKRGLRARLQTGSLLTGQLFVDTKVYDDLPSADVGHDGNYAVIPTVPSTLEKFERSAQEVLAQLRDLPLEQLMNELVGAARGANRLMNGPETLRALSEMEAAFKQYRELAGTIDKQVVPLARSIESTSTAAQSALSLAQPESELRYDLGVTLKELSAAARSLRILAEYLERHPEAMLVGKGRGRN